MALKVVPALQGVDALHRMGIFGAGVTVAM